MKNSPFLQKNDLISIIAPSGKVNKDYVINSKKLFERFGFQTKLGSHVFSQYGRFAGTQDERLSDLQEALDDPQSKAIFCARGGYGVIHLLEKLSLNQFNKNPKFIIGYSDITALHSVINNAGICSIHAPMSSHLSEEHEDAATLYLMDLLSGKLPGYQIDFHHLNKTGQAKGILRGGNLSVLASLRGTPFDFPAENTILFIEDISEQAYHIERMMYNLKTGGILKKISGLIVGQFSDCEEDESLCKTIYQAIFDLVSEYNYPVCFNFPVGHVKDNYPMICGAVVHLSVNDSNCVIEY